MTDDATHDGGQLGRLLDPDNTVSSLWADTAYRSAANVALLARRGLRPHWGRRVDHGGERDDELDPAARRRWELSRYAGADGDGERHRDAHGGRAQAIRPGAQG